MLKTLRGTQSKTRPSEGGVGIGGSSRAGRGRCEIGGMDDVEVDGGKVEVDEVGKKVQKSFKSKKTVRSSDFLTPGAKLAFTKLWQAFLKATIFHHFDPECHIQTETDVSGYAIGRILSQLTSDDLGQCHLIAVFTWKMIPAETRYETHDGELLAIIEAFKI